ncbi:MAG: rRNA ((2503)-C(2))-methyltransferase RlmN [Fibrobacterota bacterium]|jgi:23S rRNA (adenine2503-C2)-methyltransferase
MSTDIQKTSLSDLTQPELETWLTELGQPRFRAAQVQEWLWRHLATSIDEMTNVSKDLRRVLAEHAEVGVLNVVDEQVSVDGTAKWAFQDAKGLKFETVLIPDEDRRTACISSQVGCAMGCTFCRTGLMGLVRNLTAGEIAQQVAHVRRYLAATDQPPLSNIVFMGMGEPMQNLGNVLSACKILTNPKGMGMAPRRITISTSGLVEKIAELGDQAPQIHLAISLNSSNNAMRNEVMPVNKRHDIQELLAAGDAWSRKTGWPVTYEYVLIGDVTCTPEAAHEVVDLLRHRNCKLNLIPLNAADDIPMRAPEEYEVDGFDQIIRASGMTVFRRKPKGQDILAACGQLARKESGRDAVKAGLVEE